MGDTDRHGVGVDRCRRRLYSACVEARRPDADELIIVVVDVDHDTVLLRVRFTEPTIAASITTQQSELALRPPRHYDAAFDYGAVPDRFGLDLSTTEWVQQLVALVLYLCSDEPDITTVTPPAARQRATGAPRAPLEVLNVGFRIGAALRAADRSRSDHQASDTPIGAGRRTAPHLPRAHFHLYWYGPRHAPDQRRARVRWLAPIPVNIDPAELPATVRQARSLAPRTIPN